jgi:hypothetical protein
MTPTQRELARHALGLPNKMRMSYRNRFVAGHDHEDYHDWCEMCAAGWAERRGPINSYGGDDLFWLTESGARLALNKGEKLDAEDFAADKQRPSRIKNRLSDGPPLPRRYQ